MPYNPPFERVTQTNNKSALELNKILASALIANFLEIQDLDAADSSAHFTRFELDSEDEFPERHFRLRANFDEMHIGFEFWWDTLWLELGVAGNSTVRFRHVRKYADLIVTYGFAIGGVSNAGALNLDKGLEEHLKEYKD